ncbi:C-5 cytosine-specific DNA methylase [Vibrio phage 1.162.O._10N.261.48.E3]|nr:C-5 cytosine-specific DNA methylase [Vibrio phage 1.147.O._10N.286.49.E9]AUR91725.1 C-5 cytosine-specific DNA methylase [Vibrio phage 1.162.O._10N.261.48.E3]
MIELSLFDGISAGQVAMNRIGVTPTKYYAAEVDKFAIKCTQENFPNTIQLGDVTKWREWDIDWAEIDLVTGGFPCQAWSMAGKQLGDKDERGMLFWVMLDIMKHVRYHNPNANFLIENVKMKKEFEEYITYHTENALGEVHKVLINSALVSAQNRQRYYWTSKPVGQPEDKGLILADVLERGELSTDTRVSDRQMVRLDFGGTTSETIGACFQKPAINTTKALPLLARDYKGISGRQHFNLVRIRPCEPREFSESSICHHAATATDIKGNESIKLVYAETGKAPTLTTMGGGHREPKVLCGRVVGRKINPETGKRDDYNPELKAVQRFEPRLDERSGTLTTVQKDNILSDGMSYRKLTPLECERLQTFPDNFTSMLSNTQRYKTLGNSWTVDVICHIFKEMGIK